MKSFPEQIRRFFALIGPWPIEPFYLGFLTFFMVASLYSLGEEVTHSHSTRDILLRPTFSIVIALLTMWQLKFAVRILPSYSRKFATYLAILVVQSFSIWSWIVLLRTIFPAIHSSFTAFLSPLPIVRFSFTLLCINSFIGLSRSKLSAALAEKDLALRAVENQRNLLLEYDERTRSQLSEFLHDRVQSSLVTACLELQEVAGRSPEIISSDIKKIIDRLEVLRAVDVRNASQTLSPAFGNADLYTSITLMTQNYAPHIGIDFQSNPRFEVFQSEAHRDIFLGIYRITEQAFLNAHIHGKAKSFQINLTISDGLLTLRARNDGLALPGFTEKGLGTAIINSWVRTLNGSWSLRNTADGAVELEVHLPITFG